MSTSDLSTLKENKTIIVDSTSIKLDPKLDTIIFTKKGDNGTTCGPKMIKTDKDGLFCEAIGSLDECSALIGHYSAKGSAVFTDEVFDQMDSVQTALFNISSFLYNTKKCLVTKQDVELLELWTLNFNGQCPKITKFIKCSSEWHVVRTVVRRAERALIRYFNFNNGNFDLAEQVDINYTDKNNVLCYMNRLSSYFFAFARYISIVSGQPESYF